MTLRKTVLVCSVSLFFGGIGHTCAGIGFRSDQLEEMSGHFRVEWPSCDSSFVFRHGKRDVAVRVSDQCVEHIGFRIFPEYIRTEVVNRRLADFVERYWLSLTLPLERQKTVRQQLTEDRFVFLAGEIGSIDILQKDTLLPFSCDIASKSVTMTWGTAENPVCKISFPVDHELILGRRMPENDRRLPQEIISTDIRNTPVRMGLSAYVDSLSSLWVEHAGSYLDCSLKSERYYACASDGVTLEPVFDRDRSVESIMNLFTDCDIEKAGRIRLSISHRIFGFAEQTIETTVPQFVAYSIQNDCVPYVGIVSVGEDDKADVLVIMHNRQIGYNHVLRVSLPLECLSAGEGTAVARLNAFVPSSNIKNLFKK